MSYFLEIYPQPGDLLQEEPKHDRLVAGQVRMKCYAGALPQMQASSWKARRG
jgi:hypothetical protein